MRKGYRILPTVIMDAIDEGEARGSRQAKLETARNLCAMSLSAENIAKATGLSQEEVEELHS